jgi:hypothetical protein
VSDQLNGWFKAMRTDAALELIRLNPLALALAYTIAHRACWRDGFNRHGLAPGEAMLGDYASLGMTRQQYRTAVCQLTQCGFATFRTTNKGTIGKLIDTRLFCVSTEASNQQNNQRPTIDQPLTKNDKNIRILLPGESPPAKGPPRPPRRLNGTERMDRRKGLEILENREKELEGRLYYKWDREEHPELVAELAEVRSKIAHIRAELTEVVE